MTEIDSLVMLLNHHKQEPLYKIIEHSQGPYRVMQNAERKNGKSLVCCTEIKKLSTLITQNSKGIIFLMLYLREGDERTQNVKVIKVFLGERRFRYAQIIPNPQVS